jgi:hypothetical protein
VSVIAYNWDRPDHYVPSWMEIAVSLTLVTLGVVAFRWIANRMPILAEDPRFAAEREPAHRRSPALGRHPGLAAARGVALAAVPVEVDEDDHHGRGAGRSA